MRSGAKVCKSCRSRQELSSTVDGWCSTGVIWTCISLLFSLFHFSQSLFTIRSFISTSIDLQRFVSIQPRKSLSKFAQKSPKLEKKIKKLEPSWLCYIESLSLWSRLWACVCGCTHSYCARECGHPFLDMRLECAYFVSVFVGAVFSGAIILEPKTCSSTECAGSCTSRRAWRARSGPSRTASRAAKASGLRADTGKVHGGPIM